MPGNLMETCLHLLSVHKGGSSGRFLKSGKDNVICMIPGADPAQNLTGSNDNPKKF